MVGDKVLMDPFVLEEGTALMWEDNKVFHYVNPASLIDRGKEGVRTMLLLHYPADILITGEPNKNNTLGSNKMEEQRQLRKHEKLAH